MSEESSQLVLKDPRLGMPAPARLAVKFISYASWIIAAGTAAVFLYSGNSTLKWTGVLLALFVLDRAMHAREADKPLSELPHGGKVNLSEFLSPAAISILIEAGQDGSKGKDFSLSVLKELLRDRTVQKVFSRLDLDLEEFNKKIDEVLNSAEPTSPILNPEDMARLSLMRAIKAGSGEVGALDMLGALGESQDANFQKILATFSLKPEDFSRAASMAAALAKFSFWKGIPRTLTSLVFQPGKVHHRIMNRAWTSRPTPVLDKFGMDLTDTARSGHAGFLVGHEAEYRRLTETLSRGINPNALLVGAVGSGRETVIEHLAYSIVKDEVPEPLFDKRLVSLDVSLLAASAGPEELQARLNQIVKEIETAGNIILYVPNIHNLIKTSGAAYVSAADALLPVFVSNAFPVIGTTFPQEMREIIENRSDFASIFEVIQVQEISEEEAVNILVYESLILERVLKINISLEAVEKSVELAHKYFKEKMLPSSAEELLKSAAAKAKEHGKKWLRHEDVLAVASEKTNVPLQEAGEAEAQGLLHLEDKIHEELVDQEEAVKAVSGALREYRSGLSRKGGPIASFLFVGPTGVGKTELAKILSKIQFGSEAAMLRFDMTEYQDKQSFVRLIGSPDGSVPGALTDAVREKPYSLVLLDEFEKAFPDILNLFLQVLDDGRLTDNKGRLVDFQNTIIVATTNAKSEFIAQSLQSGKTIPDISEELKKELIGPFKPELLNRFSKIIVFKTLSPEELVKIADLNLKTLGQQVKEAGIAISFSAEVVRKVAELGFDPVFGARPLRRVIEEKIKAPLSEAILKKEIQPGNGAQIALENGEFKVKNLAQIPIPAKIEA